MTARRRREIIVIERPEVVDMRHDQAFSAAGAAWRIDRAGAAGAARTCCGCGAAFPIVGAALPIVGPALPMVGAALPIAGAAFSIAGAAWPVLPPDTRAKI